jgi:negative regulator of replication initiation
MMPTVRIDDEVWRCLQSKATPFVDTPNDVLRRVFGLVHATAPAVQLKPVVNTLDPKLAAVTVKANGSYTGKSAIFSVIMALASEPITMGDLLTQATAAVTLRHSKKDKQWIVRSYVRDALKRFNYLSPVA